MCETRNSNLLGKITVLFVIWCFCLPVQAKYGGGTGEPNDPYLIFTAEQMNAIGADSNDWDKYFKLMSNVDLSEYTGTEFNIIGELVSSNNPRNKPFTGVFDGNGHIILNFIYTSTDKGGIGIFNLLSGVNAEIKNLGLINPNVDAGTGDSVGSLVGWLESATITNCYVEGGSVEGRHSVGGLVGWNHEGAISNCYATGSVFGDRFVGGLVGYNDSSIVDCYTSGNVTGGDDSYCVGGLCGKSTGPDHGTVQSSIRNCYSTATVTGGYGSAGGLIGHSGAIVTGCYSTGSVIDKSDRSWSIGGLIGSNGGHGSIKNCYSTGSVVGDGGGGLVGVNNGTVFASFWDIETSGQTTSDGGAGLTTAQMQMAITFVCWGYEPVWTIDEGVDYPRLLWENKPGELITVPSHLYGGGTGEPEDPYLIYTAQQLNQIGLNTCHLDKHFRLMADIDLSVYTGTSFNIIGNWWDNPFTGVFDGNGRKIFNFIYTSTGGYNIGLFGYIVDPNAEVKNLGLIDPNVDAGTTGRRVGSLVGEMRFGNITNCYVEGGSVDGRHDLGGLVGENSLGTITNSYSTCIVSGDWYLGGLVGYQFLGTISNCYSTGRVSGDDDVGGLVGHDYESTIANSYSTCVVSGDQYVGGLVGRDYRSTISNSYVTGSVTGNSCVGGLVGRNWEGTITNCYSIAGVAGVENVGGLVGNSDGTVSASFWDVDTSGQDWSAGGRGLPTYHMQRQVNFLVAGWDFVGETANGIEDIWFIPQQDYPRLWWEGMKVPMKLTPGTLNCRSKGNWVKANLTLPEGFTVEDVDSDKPAVLHSFGVESAPLYVFINENGLVEIVATFERQALCSLAGDWLDELTVAGFLADGNIFLGTSKVSIIHPGVK